MDFSSQFHEKMAKYQPDFQIRGLLTGKDRVYPLGTDTKVLSTVFELIARPLVFEIAGENGLLVVEPRMQNFYPDFTLMKDESDVAKLAVDVKTTYRNFRRDGSWTASFTLGSYTSFLRTETKNIVFPYSEYAKHYVIGFIYTRAEAVTAKHFYMLSSRDDIPCPIADVEFFVHEKYRIAGERAGSGNTTNIGSIVGWSIEDFAQGRGPFAEAGEHVFLDYWRNYGRTRQTRPYTNLSEYYEWKGKYG
jgi:hypothetical protein